MTNTINMDEFTVAADAETVTVAEFRNRIEHLETIIHTDRHSVVGGKELARWVDRARNVGSELIGTTCKRATAADWLRRERILDRSTTTLVRALVLMP